MKYLRAANIKDGRLDLSDVKEMNFEPDERDRFHLQPGDVLVSEGSGSADAVGASAQWGAEVDGLVCFQNTLLRFRARDGVTIPGFVYQWCRWAFESGAFRDVAKGTNILHIGASRAAEMDVEVPALDVQRRIADVMTHLDAHLDNLQEERDCAEVVARELGNSHLAGESVAPVSLSELLTLRMDFRKVEPKAVYPLAGVLNQGQGLVDKGMLAGAETSYSRLNRLRAGDIVMRRLTAWEGPIAVVPPEFDGYYVSNEFPTFSVDSERLTSEFADLLCRWPGLWSEMRRRVTGTVMRRKRLSPEQLLTVTVPVSNIVEQRRIAGSVSAARATAAALSVEIQRMAVIRDAVLPRLVSGDFQVPTHYDGLIAGAS